MPTIDCGLAACPTLAFVAECALTHARRVLNAHLGNVQIVDWDSGHLSIIAQHGFHADFLRCFQRVDCSHETACGRALFLRQTVIIHDVLDDDGFAPYRSVAERSGFRAVSSIPLLSASGALYGILSVHGQKPSGPSARQLSRLEAIAAKTANRIVQLKSKEASTA